MKQVFIAGGEYDEPAEFSRTVNRNIQILMDSDRNAEIDDIQFTVHNSRFGMVYLAYIIAEVDVDENAVLNTKYSTPRKKKKKH